MHLWPVFLFLYFLVGFINVADSVSQTVTEDVPIYWLDEIVVVSDRTDVLLRESTWATSVISRSSLQQLSVRNLAEVLRYVPGLTFVEKDGSGHIPMAIVRGFFGGGETEYILLLVDGIPINDLRTGLAEWSQIPLSSIERIEILRGGSSAVYGDAALGAVVNVITNTSNEAKAFSSSLILGQQEERYLDISYKTRFRKHLLHLRASGNEADGFRAHSDWKNIFLNGRHDLAFQSPGSFYFNWVLQRLENNDPGPLTPEQISENRQQNNSFFDQDHRRRDHLQVSLGFRNPSEEINRLSADFGFQKIDQEQTRSLLLTPNFADTQFHDENNFSLWTRLQYKQGSEASFLVSGIDAEYGTYDSKYFDQRNKNSMLSQGNGNSIKVGLYSEAQKKLGNRVRTTAGLRYDLIRHHNAKGQQSTKTTKFNQWSPRLGLNVAYLMNSTYSGHSYANWSRSFKAPTLDQLFDQRQISVGPPGFVVNFSNSELRPQKSNGFEFGIYQRISVVKHRLYSEFTLSAYRIDLEDEIDFDLSTFKYGNIQKSRHSGFEESLIIYLSPRFSVRQTLNIMNVTFRSGEFQGKRLKNIPRKSLSNNLHIYLNENLQVTIAHKYISKVYLDDANSSTLTGYHTFDTKLQLNFKIIRLHLMVMNIFNNRYNSSGYVLYDPNSMQNIQYLYPSQRRYFQTGINFSM